MSYSSTLTQKGQLTIPKLIRDQLKLERGSRVHIGFSRKKQFIQIRPTTDILDLAGKFKSKLSPLKARSKLEKHYHRI